MKRTLAVFILLWGPLLLLGCATYPGYGVGYYGGYGYGPYYGGYGFAYRPYGYSWYRGPAPAYRWGYRGGWGWSGGRGWGGYYRR